jgi:hypothetical protein
MEVTMKLRKQERRQRALDRFKIRPKGKEERQADYDQYRARKEIELKSLESA